MLLSEFKPTKKATRVVENRITEEPMEFGPETGKELYPAGYENDGRLILHVVSELLPRIKDDQVSLDVMKAVDAVESGQGNKADIKTIMGVYKEAERQGITKKYKDAIGKFDQDYKDDDGEDEDETMESKSSGDAWYREQEAQDMAKKDGKDWKSMKYGQKEDYRAKVKAKYTEGKYGKKKYEAVGSFADPIYDLIEELGSHSIVLDELIRYLDGDTIEDFVSDFRRHNDMPVDDGPIDDDDPRYMDDENLPKSEGNEFSGKRQAAIDAGEDEFEVDGKKYKVEAEHKFTKNSVTEEADDDAARELELYAENDEALYRQSYVPIAKNLSKKFKKGVYDSELAKKLWKYHADRAAQKYGMDHAGGSKEGLRMFSPDTRRAFARSLEDFWHDEMKIGNFMESAVTEYEGASKEDVAGAITHRFKMNTDLLSKALKSEGGIDALMMAIDDVAEWHAGAEELGSSDISIMVREVMAQLNLTERSLSGLRNSSAFDGKDRMMALLDKNKRLNAKEKEEEEKVRKASFGEGATMVCKHCGDEMHKPTTDCECDCDDENGDHWIKKESYTESIDIVKEYKDAGYVTK